MVYGLTDRLLRDRAGATKTTYALLGAIVVVAGIGAIGGAGARLGERIAASDPAPEPVSLAAVTYTPAPVEAAPVIEIAAATAAIPVETAPVTILAAAAAHVGSEARFAPVRKSRPAPVTATRAEQARLDAIRDAVSVALATAALERAEAEATPTEAAWIPASGTLDIRPRSRPAD
jgi:Flp pilus assembly pilin Flp